MRYFESLHLDDLIVTATDILFDIDEFYNKIPLLLALRKEGLRHRHWVMIFDIVGIDKDKYKTDYEKI
jgi:dynein heavy chain